MVRRVAGDTTTSHSAPPRRTARAAPVVGGERFRFAGARPRLGYLNAERLNQLPDELEVFQRVADTLSAMSDDLTGAEPDPDTVAALEQRIVDLEGQVAALIQQLKESKRPGRGGIFLDKFAEAAGTQAGKLAILGVIGGAGWFLGRYLPPGAWADLARAAMAAIK